MIFNMAVEWLVPWATASSAVAAIMSFFVAVMQFRTAKIQEHRSLESMYLNRLWVILDKIGNSSDVDKEHVYREYINFSCDQIELRELGRITDDTWNFWSRDMKEYYEGIKSEGIFKDVLKDFSAENIRKSSYYEALMKCPADVKFDPLINPVDKKLAKKRHKYKVGRFIDGL